MRATQRITRLAAPALALVAGAGILMSTGCASPATPRTSIAPSWSYHDTPDPMAYSEVWGRPAGVGDVRVVSADEPVR